MKLILKQRKQIPIELLFEIIKFVNCYPIEVLDQMDFIERKCFYLNFSLSSRIFYKYSAKALSEMRDKLLAFYIISKLKIAIEKLKIVYMLYFYYAKILISMCCTVCQFIVVFYVILLCSPFIILMLPSILAIIVISFCIGLFFSIPFCILALYLSYLNYFNEIIIELLTTTQRYINNFLDTRRARLEEIQLAQTDWSGIAWLLPIVRR
uniref:Uncharacterized protein n=1 Tax=Meloidogyne enterolobii TaxID=390850 RepID=A0A6V7TIM7_MELEN|nr:unnamed protein product [Meloidogyne enterolobii]